MTISPTFVQTCILVVLTCLTGCPDATILLGRDLTARDAAPSDAQPSDTQLPDTVVAIDARALRDRLLFFDGFESADMSRTNTAGFQWAPNFATSIVTMDDEGAVAVFNNGVVESRPGGNLDWSAFEDDYSLRFRYGADAEASIQRFSMGAPQRDLWIGFTLRVPTNYKHLERADGSNATQREISAIWMDARVSLGEGPTVLWGTLRDDDGGSRIVFYLNEGGQSGTGGTQQSMPFIDVPTDRGRWMHLVFHVRAATNATSRDGLVETYRRWEVDGEYTRLHFRDDCNIASPPLGPNGWSGGHIMGFVEGRYDESTNWLMDNFALSTETLLP